MANYPQPIKPREELNLRLGIKSSLSQLRSILASLYVIYKANKMLPKVIYSEEINDEGYTTIRLAQTLYNDIRAIYMDETFSQLVEKSPLFTSQLEALQVGIELFFHLGKVDFVKNGLSERTGSNRYQKQIAFSTNMLLIDLYLSSHSTEDVKKLLLAWLQDKAFTSKLEEGLRIMLNTFTEETQFKIRDNNSEEVVFNQEGVYAEILSSGVVSSNDTKEPVGPFRVYKSYLSSGLHPLIVENKQEIRLQENVAKDTMECYADMVDTSLSLIPKRSIVTQEVYSSNTGKTTQQHSNQASVSYLPYLTALRTKPFMLLAGISGTGKSRIVREMAKACWASHEEDYGKNCPRNFCMVQVKPNWHDSSDLIGYVSRINGEKYVVGPFLRFIAKAMQDSKRPYFLCLDEMNLAPVEQYFAEYLSVIESRKLQDGHIKTDPIVPFENTEAYGSLIDQLFDSDEERKAYKTEEGGKRLTIPENLFVVGTVNMDETTFSFSRKVLDRAMTIEMNEVDLHGGLEAGGAAEFGYIGEDLMGEAAEGWDIYADNQALCEEVIAYLGKVNEILDGTPFKIAYRTRNEFLLYAVNRLHFAPGSETWQTLDEMTSMKILSRIEGDNERCEHVLQELKNLLTETVGDHASDSASLKKIDEMLAKLKSGYTSYWA